MITQEQVFHFLNQYDAPTADLNGIDYRDVSRFMTSETDLRLLTLIAKAEQQGLDLIYIDPDRFFNAAYGSKTVEWIDGIPWEGARYVSVDLSFILHDGHSFKYKGILEGMGYDWELNAVSMVGAAVKHFGIEDDYYWVEAPIRTVTDLIAYLNGGLRPVPVKKSVVMQVKERFTDSITLNLIYLAVVRLPFNLVKAAFKPVYSYIKELIEEQSKPLGYKRRG